MEARATLLGVRQSPDDRISSYAEGLIEQLSPVVVPVGSSTAEPDRSSRYEDIRTEPGGYDVEIGLGESSPTNDPTTSTGSCANSPRRMGCPG